MIRSFTLADLITLVNGACGSSSILASCSYLSTGESARLWLALGLLPVAGVADLLDGRVARMQQRPTSLGQQLDSLADLISFGVAPAVIGFGIGMRGGWDAVLLVYFIVCGLSRLARYNVTAAALSDASGKVRYFEGAPIPTSTLIVALLGALFAYGSMGEHLPWGVIELGPWQLHPITLVFALSGSLMISRTLHIPKP